MYMHVQQTAGTSITLIHKFEFSQCNDVDLLAVLLPSHDSSFAVNARAIEVLAVAVVREDTRVSQICVHSR